jgi:hypothetical protein
MAFVSAVNQPERVFLSSNDDQSAPDTLGLWPLDNAKYSKFLIKLPTPILQPERAQLLRASIPNIETNLPDYQLIFWYARVNNKTNDLTFHNLRLLPSWLNYQDPWVVSTGLPVNRQIVNYLDFTTLLNAAATATDDPALNPFHVPGDITFTYNVANKLITAQGNDTANYNYYLVGYDYSGLTALQQQVQYQDPAGNARVAPVVEQITLNLRVGFNQPGINLVFAPTPTGFVDGLVEPYYGTNGTFIADSYANLVYSQNCIVLANFTQGSSLGSSGLHSVLATVPMAAPPLGVSLFSSPLVNWLTKLSKQIYEIEITLLDDNSQPFLLPNGAIVNIDLGFSYTKV